MNLKKSAVTLLVGLTMIARAPSSVSPARRLSKP